MGLSLIEKVMFSKSDKLSMKDSCSVTISWKRFPPITLVNHNQVPMVLFTDFIYLFTCIIPFQEKTGSDFDFSLIGVAKKKSQTLLSLN